MDNESSEEKRRKERKRKWVLKELRLKGEVTRTTTTTVGADGCTVTKSTVAASVTGNLITDNHKQKTVVSHADKVYNNAILDEDEQFLLSMAPALRRMAQKKKAKTKLDMHRIVYNAEHGNEDRFALQE